MVSRARIEYPIEGTTLDVKCLYPYCLAMICKVVEYKWREIVVRTKLVVRPVSSHSSGSVCGGLVHVNIMLVFSPYCFLCSQDHCYNDLYHSHLLLRFVSTLL